MPALDLSSLANAIIRLTEGMSVLSSRPEDALIRDGVIQRFEFTYELSHKMLKRYLEMTSPNPAEIDTLTFQDLIRTASEQGLLLHGWDKWRDYRQARTDTSHTYDESKALLVVGRLPAFLDEARFLFEQLQARSR